MLCLNHDNRFNKLNFYSCFVSVYELTLNTNDNGRLFCPYQFLLQVTWAYYGTLKQKVPVELGEAKCEVNTTTNLMRGKCNGHCECQIHPLSVLRTYCNLRNPSLYNLVVRYSCIQETGNLTSSNIEFQELKLLNVELLFQNK